MKQGDTILLVTPMMMRSEECRIFGPTAFIKLSSINTLHIETMLIKLSTNTTPVFLILHVPPEFRYWWDSCCAIATCCGKRRGKVSKLNTHPNIRFSFQSVKLRSITSGIYCISTSTFFVSF